jgi:hypothetical protein
LGEYPNSTTCNQLFESGELSFACDIPGTEHAIRTNFSLLRGKNWEYDSSQEDAPHLDVPSPRLINHGKLKLEKMTSWVDRNGTIQVMPVKNIHGDGILVRESLLKDFLQHYSLILVFIIYRQKNVVSETFDAGDAGVHARRAVYKYDGKKIAEIHSFSEIR